LSAVSVDATASRAAAPGLTVQTAQITKVQPLPSPTMAHAPLPPKIPLPPVPPVGPVTPDSPMSSASPTSRWPKPVLNANQSPGLASPRHAATNQSNISVFASPATSIPQSGPSQLNVTSKGNQNSSRQPLNVRISQKPPG